MTKGSAKALFTLILLVFNRLKETWLSIPIPAAEMLLKVSVSLLALIEGKVNFGK